MCLIESTRAHISIISCANTTHMDQFLVFFSLSCFPLEYTNVKQFPGLCQFCLQNQLHAHYKHKSTHTRLLKLECFFLFEEKMHNFSVLFTFVHAMLRQLHYNVSLFSTRQFLFRLVSELKVNFWNHIASSVRRNINYVEWVFGLDCIKLLDVLHMPWFTQEFMQIFFFVLLRNGKCSVFCCSSYVHYTLSLGFCLGTWTAKPHASYTLHTERNIRLNFRTFLIY